MTISFKNLAIYSTALFIISGVFGFIVSEKTRPTPPDPVVIHDTVPPTYDVIKVPATDQEYIDAFNSRIEIIRSLSGNLYNITATDGYKQTKIQDKIIIPIITPKWMIQADIYTGIVDRKLFYMAGASFDYFYSKRVYFGGGLAGSDIGFIIHGAAGFVFY